MSQNLQTVFLMRQKCNCSCIFYLADDVSKNNDSDEHACESREAFAINDLINAISFC